MNGPRHRAALAMVVAMMGPILNVTGAIGAPASAEGGCPRPDDRGNVAVVRGGETAHLPGSTNADFCGADPDHAVTQVWNDGPEWNVKRLAVPQVGVWRIEASGRISFTPDPAFLTRPAGDTGPGHDAILKYKVVDADRRFGAGVATVYVLYPGVTSRPDAARTSPGHPVELRPFRNDVASWSGQTRSTLRHARFVSGSLRLVGSEGPRRQLSTDQGRWRVAGRTVIFTPVTGFVGRTDPVPYLGADSHGDRSGSTITVTVGDGSAVAGTMSSATRASAHEEPPTSSRARVPGILLVALLGLSLVAFLARRGRTPRHSGGRRARTL